MVGERGVEVGDDARHVTVEVIDKHRQFRDAIPSRAVVLGGVGRIGRLATVVVELHPGTRDADRAREDDCDNARGYCRRIRSMVVRMSR